MFKKFFKGSKKKNMVEKKEEVNKKEESEKFQSNIENKKVENAIKEEKVDILKDESLKEKIEEVKKEEVKKEELEEKKTEKKGFFTSLKEKLTKSREGLFGKLKNFFSGRSVIDDEMYEDLEELLIQSDIGFDMTLKIVENLEKEVKTRGIKEAEKVYDVLKDVLERFLIRENNKIELKEDRLNIILVVGVNGVGKTTTIGKMISKFKSEGKKVIIGAADTFRAAAIEQLEEWAIRSEVDIVKHSQGADPGAVVFDTLKAAKSRNMDVAIIDTAGRLHNKKNLMDELSKINKIIKKEIGENEPYETLLVIDGTTGQNGLTQARVFNEVTKLTGFVITKLDGTAKGGIIFAISEELKKPVKFIGVGEGIEDLREFDADEFINAIFE
ncbi:signal recognition particle-docking protein FtsY [Haliovirga abyssi]|uniref:Signal recognition particle receptor FtsY n=1 Tax=Haliovirga abyssi TaxID=2996794 RepID=A0AAU9DFU5_9FUSO|nr:signal recognition particle-docking protein FtsY [Haliovirga abyssi]BDU50272.1 signal recognition particle receptor FtsY [Haliovirga abyssi]